VSLSALIVDDEQLARDELAYLLKDLGDVDVVAQGKNGLEAVNLIREHNPDLVFLDVQMPGLDGFGVIKKLLDKKLPIPKIVFSTAFDQYAVKAFEVNAIDYLLKLASGNYALFQEAKNTTPLNMTIRDAVMEYVKAETKAGRPIRATLDNRFVQVGPGPTRAPSSPND